MLEGFARDLLPLMLEVRWPAEASVHVLPCQSVKTGRSLKIPQLLMPETHFAPHAQFYSFACHLAKGAIAGSSRWRADPLQPSNGLKQKAGLCSSMSLVSLVLCSLQVYASTVQPQVRTQALLTLSKMVHFATPDILRCATCPQTPLA